MAVDQQELVGSQPSGELKRTMTFFPALSTVMGTVIGAGVFFKAASVAAVTGSTSLHMLSWFLGGLISVCAGLTGAEFSSYSGNRRYASLHRTCVWRILEFLTWMGTGSHLLPS